MTMETPKTLRLRKLGNSLGVILDKEVLDALGIERKVGEIVVLRKGETSGRFEISAGDSEFDRRLASLRKITANNREALRELAK